MPILKPKFNDSFKRLLVHLQQDNVMQSLALCRYIFIYMPCKKDITPYDLKNDSDLYTTIRDRYFTSILGGEYYSIIGRGYLSFNENLMDNFYKYKMALSFPNETLATCPDPQKTKQILIDKITEIVKSQDNVELTANQQEWSKKYHEYILFTIRHITFYCAHFDNDFLMLGRQLFKDFDRSKSSDKISHFIASTLNEHIDNYNLEKKNLPPQSWLEDLSIRDERVENLYNNIVLKEPLNNDFFKLKLNSHKKGKLGEQVFGDLINGDVIGYKNNKTDIIEEGKNISLKTSYSSSWNHHLAYLDKAEQEIFLECLDNKQPFSKLKNIDWENIINRLFCGQEDINEIVFQKIVLDNLNKNPTDIKVWRFLKEDILDIIKNKQFIFQKHNIVLYHNQEQFVKLSFKKRSNAYQVMITTDEEALNNMVEDNFGKFSHPVQNDKKIYSIK